MSKAARIKNRATKTKGRKVKKWAKGHSSDSNPTITKHREMAANGRFVINENVNSDGAEKSEKKLMGGKKLRFETTHKLMTKSENMLQKLRLEDKDEANSDEECSLAETAETQFSRFTNCTNPTFNKVHRMWKSGSELQNDVLSVLAAVTEVIKKSGGQESEVEYFAALVTSFSDPQAVDQSALDAQSATAYLLSLVITKVPYAVLIGYFSQLSEIFFNKLSQHATNPHANALVRYLLDCFGVLLKAQPLQTWESPVLSKMCHSLLVLTVDDRPKIRKAAQRAISDIVNSLQRENLQFHPAAKLCAQFCTETIDKCGGDGKNVGHTLHAVHLLQRCMQKFSQSSFKTCAETLLKLMTLCSATVCHSVMECFAGIFSNKPTNHTLTPETSGQLILAFYDFEPPKADHFSYLQWCKVQLEAHCCLVEKDAKMASHLAPKFLEKILQELTVVDQQGAIFQLAHTIKRFLKDCLQILLEKKVLDQQVGNQLGLCLKDLLNLKFLPVWPVCFEILSLFFETCAKNDKLNAVSIFDVKNMLKSMGELRESENFTVVAPLEKCLGHAVKFLGPDTVLDAIRLTVDPTVNLASELPNSWILPILRQNIQNADLAHFIVTFLPVAVKLKNRLEFLCKTQQPEKYPGEKRILDTLQQQIWELLPAYCRNPVDLQVSFKKLAPILRSLLSSMPLLRLVILNCLRTLILKSRDDPEKLSEMVRFAPEFLPHMIGLFLNDPTDPAQILGYDSKGVRLACLETIRIYLSIAPLANLKHYLKVALEKMNNSDQSKTSADQKHRVLDILVAMVKHLDHSSLVQLFDAVKIHCNQCKDKSLQKKAYRVLEEAFNSESVQLKAFFDSEQTAIKAMLFTSLAKASPSTKASRVRCLTKLFENGFLAPDLIPGILPSVVMCLKEINVKTRRSSAIFFITVCNVAISHAKDAQKGSAMVWDSLEPILDGQEPQEISCALIAARLFVFEFKNDCPSDLLSALLSRVISKICSENRQIVQSCLEFLKTFVSCTSQIVLGQYLQIFVPAFYTQTPDCQHHFRFLTRKILAKLMRKIPYELVFKLVPAGPFQKQLNNVRKMLQRYEKKKLTGSAGGKFETIEDDLISGVTGLSKPETIADLLRDTSDEGSNDEEEGAPFDKPSDSKSRRSRRSVNLPVFLRENDADTEILDFLDSKSISMLQHAGKTSIKKAALKRENHGFKVDDSGRLIIGVLGDDEEKTDAEMPEFGGKRKKTENEEFSPKRRKKVEFLKDDEDSDIDEALHYKSGGKGIHRNMGEDDHLNSGGQFKAKKAQGDVKKGAVQPYAYVPLDFKQLNKRKRAKSAGKFKNLTQGARKGATKGSKGRRKLKRL